MIMCYLNGIFSVLRRVCGSGALGECHYLFNKAHEASAEPPGLVPMTLQ